MIQKIKSRWGLSANLKQKYRQEVKPFYLEWVDLKDLFRAIHTVDASAHEKRQLAQRAIEVIHLEVLESLLVILPHEEHEQFVLNVRVLTDPYDLLEQHSVPIEVAEQIVTQRIALLVEEIIRTIDEQINKY